MDEPFSALDPLCRERLQNELRDFFEENAITSVIVTHDINEAVYLGDQIAVFSQTGKEIQQIVDNPAVGIRDRNRVCYKEAERRIEEILTGGTDVA